MHHSHPLSRRTRRRWGAAMAAALLAGASGIVLTREHWWTRIDGFAATQDGRAAEATLWRSGTGLLYLSITQPEPGDYVISPAAPRVLASNTGQLRCIGRIGFTPTAPPMGVAMPSAKIERDPQLTLAAAGFEFTLPSGRRLHARY